MRYMLVLLAAVFAVPAFGQAMSAPGAENPQTANWSKLGPTIDGPRGFTLSGRGMRINSAGQYEMWVKIVPTDAASFIKRFDLPAGTGYVMQYATVDCTKKLLSLEKTAIFDAGHKQLQGRITGITPSSKKESVKKGSIGESLFRFVCEEPTAMPLNRESE